jgi:hypothetical protein
MSATSSLPVVTASGDTGGSNHTKMPANPHITAVSPAAATAFRSVVTVLFIDSRYVFSHDGPWTNYLSTALATHRRRCS